MKRIRGIAVVVALVVAALSVQLASAHATLIASDPPIDGVTPVAPDEVRLTFDLELDPDLSSMRVAGPDGAVVADGGPDLNDPDRVSLLAGLPDDLPVGDYTVSWSVVEVDADEDHAVEGQYIFTIDPSASPASTPTVTAVAPMATTQPAGNPSTIESETDDDDDGIGRGALIVGGVTILVALAVVTTVGRRRWST